MNIKIIKTSYRKYIKYLIFSLVLLSNSVRTMAVARLLQKNAESLKIWNPYCYLDSVARSSIPNDPNDLNVNYHNTDLTSTFNKEKDITIELGYGLDKGEEKILCYSLIKNQEIHRPIKLIEIKDKKDQPQEPKKSEHLSPSPIGRLW